MNNSAFNLNNLNHVSELAPLQLGTTWKPILLSPPACSASQPHGICRAAYCWDRATVVEGNYGRCSAHAREARGALDYSKKIRRGTVELVKGLCCWVCGGADEGEAKLDYLSIESAKARICLRGRVKQCDTCPSAMCEACVLALYVNGAYYFHLNSRWVCATCVARGRRVAR